tara:strand:+ start:4413 stop:4955 length:543 start_codon:yes stop_codon:yes gene_type:complete
MGLESGKYSGIYMIINTRSYKTYVGSSSYINRRVRQHRSALNKGVHHSPHLQKSWNKHCANNFDFELLERCGVADLLTREQYWIDKNSPEFNMCPIAGSKTGSVWSEEAKKNQSDRYKGIPRNHKTSNKPVIQLDMEGNEVARFDTITKAKKDTGVRHISEACRLKNGRAQAGGFKWTYE